MSESTSSVAASPSFCPRAQISPTSRPTLSGLLTPTPTSSNRGCLTISAITILPTKPVPQTTTRFLPESTATPVTLTVDQASSDDPGGNDLSPFRLETPHDSITDRTASIGDRWITRYWGRDRAAAGGRRCRSGVH